MGNEQIPAGMLTDPIATHSSPKAKVVTQFMPLYSAICVECDTKIEFFAKVKDRKKLPRHCGKRTKRLIEPPQVAPMFQEYRAVGIPGKPWISTKQQHIDTLRQHGKIEVGNDSSMMPVMNNEEFREQQRTAMKEIENDFKTTEQARKLLTSP